MDKQKEIEKMEIALNTKYRQDTHKFATALYNAGYGDVKQAVREFAKKLKNKLKYFYDVSALNIDEIEIENFCWIIDELVKEVCGE